MKSAIVPIFCGLILTAITAAGVSHWWSVREIIVASHSKKSPPPPVAEETKPAPVLVQKKSTPPAPVVAAVQPAAPAPNEEFYRSLIENSGISKTKNRDLKDQMAETNRDLMKLEFRVDTHSESFRPLPVSEDRRDTTLDTSPLENGVGVLPPLDPELDLPVH